MPTLSARLLLAAALLSIAAAAPALAHHGWSWTQDGFFQLEGRVGSVSYGNPHPVITVDAEGETWRVELAPPSATRRAGFTAETAQQGDEITAIGNRSRDEAERRMKAVRLVHKGRTYDIYPGRAPTN